MASLNKVFLIGNVTRDPEIRYTPGGSAICTLGLATNRKFTTSSGEEREEVCFVDIDVWGKQAENCHANLRKGAPIFVEGRLKFDQWDDRDTGRKRSRLLVTAERVQFLGQVRSSNFNEQAAEYSASGPSGPERIQSDKVESAPAPPPFPIQEDGREKNVPTGNAFATESEDESIDDIPF